MTRQIKKAIEEVREIYNNLPSKAYGVVFREDYSELTYRMPYGTVTHELPTVKNWGGNKELLALFKKELAYL